MLRDTIVNTISLKLGRRPDLKQLIESMLDDARKTKLESNTGIRPWYLLTQDTVSLAANSHYAKIGGVIVGDVGGLFLSEPTIGFLSYEPDGTANFLEKVSYDVARLNFDGTGDPAVYTWLGPLLHIFPAPSSSISLVGTYYKSYPNLLDDTNPHLVYAADWLEAEAGIQVAQITMNEGAFAYYSAMVRDAKARILSLTEDFDLKNEDLNGYRV